LKILAFYEKACCNRRRLMGKMIADLNSITTTTTTTTIKHTHTHTQFSLILILSLLMIVIVLSIANMLYNYTIF